VEYSPSFIALILFIELKTGGNPPFWIKCCMVGATLSRFLTAYSLLTQDSGKPPFIRFAGAIMTYVFGGLLSTSILFI